MFSSIHTDNLIVLATNPAPEGRHSCRFLVICKLHGLLVISFGNTWPLASFFFCNEFPPPLAQKLPKPLTGADLYSSFDSRSSSHNVSHQCWFFEASPTTWEIFVSWKSFPNHYWPPVFDWFIQVYIRKTAQSALGIARPRTSRCSLWRQPGNPSTTPESKANDKIFQGLLGFSRS